MDAGLSVSSIKGSVESLSSACVGIHGLFVRSAHQITDEVLAEAVSLAVIVRGGSGHDNIDVSSASRRGIVVYNTPGINANAVAGMRSGAAFIVL
jgi:D-3-phosphoglycerate dehydrogenase